MEKKDGGEAEKPISRTARPADEGGRKKKTQSAISRTRRKRKKKKEVEEGEEGEGGQAKALGALSNTCKKNREEGRRVAH